MARTPPARTIGQRPLIGVVAAAVLALGAVAVAEERDASETAAEQLAGEEPAPDASTSPEPGRSAEVVGPARGADIEAYIADRRAALADAPAAVDTAVVSFREALTLADALTVVGDTGTVRGVLYRVPMEQFAARTLPIEQASDAAGELEDELAQRVDALLVEQRAAQELLDSGTVDDEAFLADYERLVEEVDDALAAIDAGRVVHGVVLRASLDQLQELQDAPGVRLVDPAPAGTDVAVSTFHGLLPGDQDTVSQGRAL